MKITKEQKIYKYAYEQGKFDMNLDTRQMIIEEFRSCIKIHKNCEIHRDIILEKLKNMLKTQNIIQINSDYTKGGKTHENQPKN